MFLAGGNQSMATMHKKTMLVHWPGLGDDFAKNFTQQIHLWR